MFAVLFISALVTAHATEIPSYIRACGRKDSNYDQCIADNLNSVKDKFCTGFPEFNISPIEPVIFDTIVIYDTDNLKLYLRDAKLKGFCDYVVNSVHTDSDRLQIDFEAVVKQITIDTSYDFDIHVLVSLANKGLVSITADNALLKVNMQLKVATKNNEKEIYASKVSSNVNIAAFKYKFDDSEKELLQLHQAISNVVDSNTQDIIDKVRPVIEERISQIIISLFNGISRSNYEKLFPENA